jgi:hypothetical protein
LRKDIAKKASDNDYAARLRALTKTVIADIETGAIKCVNAEDVLRFLKTDKTGIQSPDFVKLWLEPGR